MPAPPGVVQGGARHCDEVCLAARDYFLSLLGIRDQTHRDGCNLGPIADGVGERHLIAWADATKASRTRTMPARSNATGGISPSICDSADGAYVCQPPCAGRICWPPFHGTSLDALRPAWPSCRITEADEYSWIASMDGFN